MKALLMKDFYTLWRQLRVYLLVMLVISVFNGSFGNIFITIWAALLPYTAMAYDERSKWDQMAAMMPYSTRDIVLGKYAFGWLCIGAAAVLSALLQAVLSLAVNRTFLPGVMALSVLGALCILAITLPLMFRFGVERGRLAMFLIIFLVCGAAGAIANIAESVEQGTSFAFQGSVLVILLIAAVVLTAVSIPLSQRFYRERMG